MRFLFACGGTAGHINPALAIASELRALLPDSKFLFVGAPDNMETALVPREGFEIKAVRVSSLHRSLAPKEIVHNIKAGINIGLSLHQARKIIKEFRPDIAIGTGGYVCYPVLRAASKMGIPTVVHESNAVPGLTTKMLSGTADRILVGFKDSVGHYKKPERVIVTGTPVRGDFLKYDKASARSELGLGKEPLVVSFWGSLGASRMNEIMADFIKLNCAESSFRHIHATGGGEMGLQLMLSMLKERGIKDDKRKWTDLRHYIYDMPLVMAAADVILCRAGASTISELTVMGKPAVLIPSPYVTNNHQEKNALVIQKHGGAKMLREDETTGEMLYETVRLLTDNPGELKRMSAVMLSLGNQRSTEKIIEIILDLIKK